MKKFTAILLSTLLVLASILIVPLGVSAEEVNDADFLFEVRSVNASLKAGDTVKVDVAAIENKGFAYGSVKAEWDKDALELTDVVYTDFAPDNNASDVKNSGKYIARFGSYTASENTTGTGILFSLIFKITEAAEEADYPITLSNAEVLNSDSKTLTAYTLSGNVVLGAYKDKALVLEADKVKTDEYETEVSVPVKATKNNGYKSGSVLVSWDEKALSLSKVNYSDNAPNNGSAAVSNSGSYTVKFGGSKTYSGTGTFFTLVFKVIKGAEDGSYTVGLGNAEVTDGSGKAVETGLTSGAVIVKIYSEIYVPTEGTKPTDPPEETVAPDTTPIADPNYSGKCGECDWLFVESTGTLIIHGTGGMDNFGSSKKTPWAQHIDKIKKVEVRNGVTTIGNSAFRDLKNLTEASLTNTLTVIEDYAFLDCGLTKITVPASVTEFGSNCIGFSSSPATSEEVGDDYVYTVVSGFMMYGESGSAAETYAKEDEVPFTSTTFVEPTTESATEYIPTLPPETDPIETSIIPPESETETEGGNNSGTIGDLKWSFDTATGTITISGTGEMPDFDGGTRPWDEFKEWDLKSIVINEGVTSVGNQAFEFIPRVTSISLPSTLKSIGNGAFSGAVSLTALTIPTGVEKIGDVAFSEAGISSVRIPNTVKELGVAAFNYCQNLSSVTIGSGISSISDYAFFWCAKLKSITIPKTVTNIGNYALGYVVDEEQGVETTMKDFEIRGEKSSAAEKYAKDHGFKFTETVVPVETDPTNPIPTETDKPTNPIETDKPTNPIETDKPTNPNESETSKPSESETTPPQKQTITLSYLPSAEQYAAGYRYEVVVQGKDGKMNAHLLEASVIKLGGVPVYSATFEIEGDLALVIFQIYSGDTWVAQVTKNVSKLDDVVGKIITADGSVYGEEKPTEPQPTETDKPVQTPKLNKTSLRLKAGATATLKVTNGKAKSFKSSKKAIATVDKKGKVTALSKGNSTITVTTTKGKKLTCKVKVQTNPTLKIGGETFRKSKTYIIKKDKTLTVNIKGKAAAVKNKYKTNKPKIAKVTSKANESKKIIIKAYKETGKATVTIIINGVTFRVKVKVEK